MLLRTWATEIFLELRARQRRLVGGSVAAEARAQVLSYSTKSSRYPQLASRPIHRLPPDAERTGVHRRLATTLCGRWRNDHFGALQSDSQAANAPTTGVISRNATLRAQKSRPALLHRRLLSQSGTSHTFRRTWRRDRCQ